MKRLPRPIQILESRRPKLAVVVAPAPAPEPRRVVVPKAKVSRRQWATRGEIEMLFREAGRR